MKRCIAWHSKIIAK